MAGTHEYKVVPAPSRAVRAKGVRGTADRFAYTLAGALNEQAAEGWEFLRTETLMVEERKGLFGRRTVSQTVMVFRRALRGAAAAAHVPPLVLATPAPAAGPAPALGPAPPLAAAPAEPVPDARPEPVFSPGALLRAEGPRKFPPLRRADDPEGAAEDGERRG